MKKLMLFIVALVATLSMNAQTTEIYKGSAKEATYSGADVTVKFGVAGSEPTIEVYKGNDLMETYKGSDYKVVSKELPPPPAGSIGTAKRTGDIDVNWVQLWKGGPKFATYNVGVTDGKAESFGDKYTWSDDIAESNWGGDWHMPTRGELSGLLNNCDVQWTANYNGTGKAGRIFTGKGDYISNSIFLPAAGYNDGNVIGQGSLGYYWSSTPNGSDNAYFLGFASGSKNVGYNSHSLGYSVRAVYDNTKGIAQRNGGAKVKWVQLWEGGPKFAEYNVGAENNKAEDYGGYYCWGKTTDKDPLGAYNADESALTGTDDTATNLWGSNWRMPTMKDFTNLKSNCTCTWKTNYNGTDVNGLLCTGKGDYSSNSIFLPAAGVWSYRSGESGANIYQGESGNYWSSTSQSGVDYAFNLNFLSNEQGLSASGRYNGYSVRAVLAK